MSIKKLISVFCALVMIVTCAQIPAFAADYTAIDLSENKTGFTADDAEFTFESSDEAVMSSAEEEQDLSERKIEAIDLSRSRTAYTLNSENPISGTIEVNAIFDNGDFENISGDGNLSFSSSDEDFVTIDQNGSFTLTRAGMATITVSYKDLESSMVIYCTEESLVRRTNSVSYEYESGSSVVQMTDPVYGGFAMTLGKTNEHANTMIAPNGSFGNPSYMVSMWIYDYNDGKHMAYFGFGDGELDEKGDAKNGKGKYIRFGATSNTATYYTATSKSLSGIKYAKNEKIPREKGWHHILALVNFNKDMEAQAENEGITTIAFYYDGEEVVNCTYPATILPYKIYAPHHPANNTTSLGMPFKERVIAYLIKGGDPVEYIGSNTADDAVISADHSFEFNFSGALDPASIVSAEFKEIETGEIIKAAFEINKSKLILTPTSPLMAGRSYSVEFGSDTTIKNVPSIFVPTAIVPFEPGNITVLVEKGDNYAENLAIDDSVKFSANITGEGVMIVSQYGEKGTIASLETTTSGSVVDKKTGATRFEGYVVSSINEEKISALASPVSYGEDTREVISAESKSGSYADLSYDADADMVEVHIASKYGRKGLPVIVRVMNKGKNYADATKDNFSEIYNRFEVLETGENGKIDYAFKYEGEQGEHEVIVNMPFDEPFHDSLMVVTKGTIADEIEKIQNGETDFEAAREYLDLNYSDFDELENQNIVYEMLKKAEPCSELSEFSDLFEECVTLVKALENDDIDSVKENATKWGIAGLKVYQDYLALDSVSNVNEKLLDAGFSDYEELKTLFIEAVLTELVCSIESGDDVYSVLEKIDEEFEGVDVDFSGYSSYSGKMKEKTLGLVYDSASEITSISALVEKFYEAVKEVEEFINSRVIETIDLSKNRTYYSLKSENPISGTIEVNAIFDNGDFEDISGDGNLSFSSSDEDFVTIDQNGSFTLTRAGMATITVKYKNLESSMVIYCTEEGLVRRSTSSEYEYESGSSVVQMTDPVYGDFAMTLGKTNEHANTMIAPSGSFGNPSYMVSMWIYDYNDGKHMAYFGFGDGELNEEGKAENGKGKYIRFGATSNTVEDYTVSSNKMSGITYTKNEKIPREKGWHHILALVSFNKDMEAQEENKGTTTIVFYYDGKEVANCTYPATILPYKIYAPHHPANDTKNLGMPFKERSIAYFITGDPVEYIGSNTADNAVISADHSFEFNFSGALDPASIVSAEFKEIETGERIKAAFKINESKLILTPTSPLMAGRSYSVEIGSDTTIKNTPSFFVPTAIVPFEPGNITVLVEKGNNYAENLVIDDSVKFSANITGEGVMIVSQYGEKGTIVSLETTTSGSVVDKKTGATRFEGYVVSSINEEKISALAFPVSYGEDTRGNIASGTSEGSYADLKYNTETDMVEVHIASKYGRKGLPVIVRVMNKGKNYADATKENLSDVYKLFEVLETGENGKIDFEFKLDGEGRYEVLINMPFDEGCYRDYVISYSAAQILDKIEAIQDGTSTIEAAREYLDLNYSDYDNLSNKAIVSAMLVAAPACETITAFEKLLEECVETVEILENNDLERIKENKEKWGIKTTSLYNSFIELESESDRNLITDEILKRGFKDYSSLSTVFEDVVVTSLMKNILNYTEIFSLVQSINDVLLLELPQSEPTDAMIYLAEKLGEVDGVESLKAKYLEAIEEKGDGTEVGSGEGSGSTGGSSGGSSGGGNGSGGLSGGSGSGLTTDVRGDYVVDPEEVAGSETPQWVLDEIERKNRKVFNDLESALWAEDSIRELYNLGIISGKGEGVFAPHDCITREEAAKILVLMAGIDVSAIDVAAENPFADVDSSAWYAPYVVAAYKNNIVNGIGEATFGTGAYVTREELCTLADRAAISADIFLDDEFTIFPFDDETQISEWALNSVLKMRESFIVSGMGGNVFNPKAQVTRAQAAKIIYGVIAYAAQ